MDIIEMDNQLTMLLALAIGTGVGLAFEDIVLEIFMAVALSIIFVKYFYRE
jgi:hypothetical protein